MPNIYRSNVQCYPRVYRSDYGLLIPNKCSDSVRTVSAARSYIIIGRFSISKDVPAMSEYIKYSHFDFPPAIISLFIYNPGCRSRLGSDILVIIQFIKLVTYFTFYKLQKILTAILKSRPMKASANFLYHSSYGIGRHFQPQF